MNKNIIMIILVGGMLGACSGNRSLPNNATINRTLENQSSDTLTHSTEANNTDAESTQTLETGTTQDVFAAVKAIDSCPNKDCRRMNKKVPPEELWCKSGYKSCPSNGVTIKSQ